MKGHASIGSDEKSLAAFVRFSATLKELLPALDAMSAGSISYRGNEILKVSERYSYSPNVKRLPAINVTR